jgi:3-oxoacyl-[acyl-carrier protein] reductase
VEAAAAAAAEVGGADVLICSAGIVGPSEPLWKYSPEDWNRMIRVNLDGVFHCCKAIVPLMIRSDYGRIVNISSIAGKEGNPNGAAYSAAKAAVIALTKSLGKELADKNIAVNCITPTAALTKLIGTRSSEQLSAMIAKVPRGRFVRLEEVARLVAWVASEDNSFTTAGVFDISGGRATY